jgi:dienelactone hydrolase
MNQSAIIKEKVELAVADGTRMATYVARPEHGGPHPGLLVFQEAFGVNHHIRNVTESVCRGGIRGDCSGTVSSHGASRIRG